MLDNENNLRLFCSVHTAELRVLLSVVLLKDLKLLENINNTTANSVLSEQSCTVAEMKRKML